MIKLTAILEDCWKDYKQYGMKKKRGKLVPNCVLVDEEAINEIGESTAKPLKWRAASDPVRKIKLSAENIMGRHNIKETGWIKVEYLAQSEVNPKAFYIINLATQLYNAGFDHTYTPKSKSSAGALLVRVNVSFTLSTDVAREEPETNLNEQYRVMSTVIECIKDYIDHVEGLVVSIGDDEYTCIVQTIYIAPKSDTDDPNSNIDSRRGRLYQAFIQKNLEKLPIDMKVETKLDMFVLNRKNIFDKIKF
jgi:hypothetical protein